MIVSNRLANPTIEDAMLLQLAQGDSVGEGEGAAAPVGEIAEADGAIVVRHLDGSSEAGRAGTPVHLGDTVETAAEGGARIVFVDGAVLTLDGGTVMTVDELVYHPEGDDSSMLLGILKGAFEFLSGKIAPAPGDGMAIQTPAGTLSVRGTSGAGAEDPATGNWHFSLMRDLNGHLGRIVIVNRAGEVLLDEEFETTRVADPASAPDGPRTLTPAEMLEVYGDAVRSLPHLQQELRPDQQQGNQGLDPGALRSQILAAAESLGLLVANMDSIAGAIGRPAMLPLADIWTPDGNAPHESGALDDSGSLAGLLGGHVNSVDGELLQTFNPILPAGQTLYGTAGNDAIIAGPGSDLIYGSVGNDSIDGGAGIDTLRYDGLGAGIVGNLFTGVVTKLSGNGTDTVTGIEHLVGTGNDDTLTAGPTTVRLDGAAGNDILNSPTNVGRVLDGGSGDDTWNVGGASGLNLALNDNVRGIENVDINGIGANTLALTAQDVIHASDTDVLVVLGGVDDSVVSAGQGWVANGSLVFGANTYNRYDLGGATLYVDSDINQNIS